MRSKIKRMETKKVHSGKLRLLTYDAAKRLLHVEFDDGSALDYDSVDRETWRRFSTSGVAWSFYRDTIEEEFPARRSTVAPRQRPAALDALFGGSTEAEPEPTPLPPGLADLFKKPGEG
jgi:hypothetical protein